MVPNCATHHILEKLLLLTSHQSINTKLLRNFPVLDKKKIFGKKSFRMVTNFHLLLYPNSYETNGKNNNNPVFSQDPSMVKLSQTSF